jgi:hypothetical protein
MRSSFFSLKKFQPHQNIYLDFYFQKMLNSDNKTFLLINNYLNAFRNSTANENGHLQKIIENIIESGRSENRLQIVVLTVLLGFFSVVGTLSNLFVIIVFSFNVKNFKRLNIAHNLNQDPLTAPVLANNAFFQQNFRQNFSNLQRFYSLIKYLAMTDLFTCAIAIPSTIFEIWYDKHINEFFCKIFEQFRATGRFAANISALVKF